MTERDFAVEVVQRLKQCGHQAYWAGGCVRDLLMGNLASDYDVATSAKPHEIRSIFGHSRTLAVGAAFGVIIVLSPNRKHQVEVATFRTDAHYSDGRHPDSVSFSTPEMDAQRRDFTINGIFYDPIEQQVIDFVGGQADLKNGILRAIGDAESRIAEDKLRMLRAIRFAARFSLRIDLQTQLAITHHADEAATVSGERLAVELQKTLETPRAAWAVEQWAETGLMRVLLPEAANRWHDCGTQILQSIAAESRGDWRIRLALLFAALAPTVPADFLIESAKDRLRLSNDAVAALRFMIHSLGTLQSAPYLAWSQVQPLMISQWIRLAIGVLTARERMGELSNGASNWLLERLAWPTERLNPPPLLDGSDLIKLGIPAGPVFKRLLHELRCQQLDEKVSGREEAIAWVLAQTRRAD